MHIDDEMPDDFNSSNFPCVLDVAIKKPQAATPSSAGAQWLVSALKSVVFPAGI